MLTTPKFALPYAENADDVKDFPTIVDAPRAALLDALLVKRYGNAGNPLQDVVNTAALTSILSQVIPAGLMGTKGRLRISVIGDWKNQSGGAAGTRLQVLFGGTTMMDGSNNLGTSVANRAPWSLRFELGNLGVANAQFIEGRATFDDPSQAQLTTGMGTFTSAPTSGYEIGGSSAVDTALAQTLEIKLAPTAANANLSFRIFSWLVEVLPA